MVESRLGGCLVLVRERRIEIFLRDDSCLSEFVLSGKIRILQLLVRLCLTQLSIGLIQHRLVRPWIDDKEEVPFIDHVAGPERDIVEYTR